MELHDERFANKGYALTRAIIHTYIEFERLLGILSEAGFDENFWSGAGLG